MEYTFFFHDDTVEVIVSNIRTSGKDIPATYWEPAEHAELDSYDVIVNLWDEDGEYDQLSEHNGQWLIDALGIREDLDAKIWKALENRNDDY